MSVDTHPSYIQFVEYWQLGEDSYDGEHAVKKAGDKYLPPTTGHRKDGYGQGKDQPGQQDYDAYKLRAVYPDIYSEAVQAAIGIMHAKPPTISLPPVMKEMELNSTLIGESLEMVLARINTMQLITGRLGILGDIAVEADGSPRPVVVLYTGQAIMDWDDGVEGREDLDITFLKLNESAQVRDPATNKWKFKERYRICSLVDPVTQQVDPESVKTVYGTAVIENDDEIPSLTYTLPGVRGTPLEGMIPFSFVNSRDLSPEPELPPLLGLANACMTIYRTEADYRQSLFMQSQDTLVRIGATDTEDEVRVGAGARIDVPVNGDAKFIGVSSQGLPELRKALENDYARAKAKSGQVTDATSRAKESGDALRLRMASQTATLPQIAKAGAAGLEKVLKALATWLGADPDQVRVKPNLEFTNVEIVSGILNEIMAAKNMGAPLSLQSIHAWLQEKGISSLSYEDEMKLLNSEAPLIQPVTLNGKTDEGDVNGDE